MKTTTLFHCDRCEFTSEKAADLSAIKLPASMATSGNADRHLCVRCRGELTEWLGDPAAVIDQSHDMPPGYRVEGFGTKVRWCCGEIEGPWMDSGKAMLSAAWRSYHSRSKAPMHESA